jgi:16S rRNA processing protein RimM
METPRMICIGTVIAAHGIRGDVKILSHTQPTGAVAGYTRFSLKSGQVLQTEHLRIHAQHAIARFSGISTRTQAEALKGENLYVERRCLPPLPVNEYYHADIIGLTTYDQDAEVIGTVSALYNFGADDVLEITCPDGRTCMTPLKGSHILLWDVTSGQLRINRNFVV